jgi:hypothetical protein
MEPLEKLGGGFWDPSPLDTINAFAYTPMASTEY